MTRGERYILLRVTNDEWWDVIHFDFRTRNDKKFYVPAKYVKPLNLVVSEKDCDHEGNSNFEQSRAQIYPCISDSTLYTH